MSSPALWQEIIRQASLRKDEGYRVVIVVSAIRGVTDALSDFIDAGDASQAQTLGKQVLHRYEAVRAEAGTRMSELEQTIMDAFTAHLDTASESSIAKPDWRAELLAFGEIPIHALFYGISGGASAKSINGEKVCRNSFLAIVVLECVARAHSGMIPRP